MEGKVLKDLEMVAEFVTDLLGHDWVKIIHRPYQRKDEGPRAISIYLAYCLV